MKILGWGAAILFLLLIAGMEIAASPDGKERIASRKAIEHCRELQNDELEPVANRRVMRGVCDGMTARYREKWKRDP